MDHVANRLQRSFQALLNAAWAVLETKEASNSQKTVSTDAALEQFYNAFQLFHASCDQAQEYVESIRQRIGSECIVDEATGPSSQKLGTTAEGIKSAIPPLSAIRLEQMSKAVRWLVLELQRGSSTGGLPAPDQACAEDNSS